MQYLQSRPGRPVHIGVYLNIDVEDGPDGLRVSGHVPLCNQGNPKLAPDADLAQLDKLCSRCEKAAHEIAAAIA